MTARDSEIGEVTKINYNETRTIDWEAKNKFTIRSTANLAPEKSEAPSEEQNDRGIRRIKTKLFPGKTLPPITSRDFSLSPIACRSKKNDFLMAKPSAEINKIEQILPKSRLLKNWLRRIDERLKFKNFFKLNTNHFRIIGDNSFIKVDSFKKRRTAALRFLNFYWNNLANHLHFSQKIIKHIHTINPEGKPKLIWNIFLCLCIVFQFFTITVELFFDSNWSKVNPQIQSSMDIIKEFLKYLILLDVCMNMFTGYFVNGNVIMEPNKILRNYLNKLLVIDFLVIFPFFLDFNESDDNPDGNVVHQSAFYNSKLSIIKLLFVFRLVKLTRTYHFIELILSNNEKIEGFLSLLKLCFKIIFTAHIFACIWYFIGDYNKRLGTENWLDKNLNNCSDCDWRTYYLHSLYWSITTMITVGYGDITPKSNVEIGFVICSMIISCGVFGYCLSSIGIIFEKIKARDTLLKNNMRVINRYMKKKNIDYELQAKIRRYINFMVKESGQESNEKEEELIKNLSFSLRKELYLQANGNILMKSPILKNNFSLKTIQKLTQIIKPIDLAPEDLIYEEKSLENDELYFISKGKVDFFIKTKNNTKEEKKVIQSCQDEDVFGCFSFFTSFPREISAVSVGYTKLFSLKRDEFLSIIRDDSNEYESFCKIRDNILLYNNHNLLQIECPSCKSKDHDILNCSLIKYLPNKQFLLKTRRSRSVLRNKKFVRKARRGINPLKILQKLYLSRLRLEEKYDFTEYQKQLEDVFKALSIYSKREDEAEKQSSFTERSKSFNSFFERGYNYSRSRSEISPTLKETHSDSSQENSVSAKLIRLNTVQINKRFDSKSEFAKVSAESSRSARLLKYLSSQQEKRSDNQSDLQIQAQEIKATKMSNFVPNKEIPEIKNSSDAANTSKLFKFSTFQKEEESRDLNNISKEDDFKSFLKRSQHSKARENSLLFSPRTKIKIGVNPSEQPLSSIRVSPRRKREESNLNNTESLKKFLKKVNLFDMSFDVGRNFTAYFPHNNKDSIISPENKNTNRRDREMLFDVSPRHSLYFENPIN